MVACGAHFAGCVPHASQSQIICGLPPASSTARGYSTTQSRHAFRRIHTRETRAHGRSEPFRNHEPEMSNPLRTHPPTRLLAHPPTSSTPARSLAHPPLTLITNVLTHSLPLACRWPALGRHRRSSSPPPILNVAPRCPSSAPPTGAPRRALSSAAPSSACRSDWSHRCRQPLASSLASAVATSWRNCTLSPPLI